MKSATAQKDRRSDLRAEISALLLALLLAVLTIGSASNRAWPLITAIGGSDQWLVQGFHGAEHNDELSFRWTTGDSQLMLPYPSLNRSAVLSLRIVDSRATPAAPRSLTVQANERDLLQLSLTHGQTRNYHLFVPPDVGLRQNLVVRLLSDAPLESANGRAIGVALIRSALMPTGNALLLPSLWLLLNALMIGGLSYLAVRLSGGGGRAALLGASLTSLLIALLLAARPPEVLPFIQHFSELAIVACLGLTLARTLVLPTRESPQGRLVLPGEELPLLLALGAWMALFFHYLLRRNLASSAGLPNWLLGSGLALALIVLALLGWRAVHDRGLPLAERRARQTRPILGLLVLMTSIQIVISLTYAFSRQGPDFWILYRGTREWMRGGSMYNLVDISTNHFGHVFKVPPFYGMFFVPVVANVDGITGLLLHRVMNTLLIVATALVWLRMWRLPLRALTTAGLLIILNFRPLFDTMAFGQIDIVLLLLLTLALWALREERDGLAGALVALGTLFKIYPLILLAFFVLKGRWRALAGFALGMLLFNGLAVAVIGWEQHRIYLFEVLPKIGGTTAWIENQTISGFLARLVASPSEAAILRNPLLQLIGTALSGLLVLAALGLTLRPVPSRSTSFALQYSLFLLLMVLTVPAAWMHYQTLLLVPFATMLLHLRGRSVSLSYAALLALSFALIAYGNQWTYYDGTIMGILTILGISYKLYGMLILGTLMSVALLATAEPAWRLGRARPAPTNPRISSSVPR